MGDADAATMSARIRSRALELFLELGVDATPLREIATGLDVTKAALYYHYPSKEELLRTLVSRLLDDLGAVLLEHEESPTSPTGVALLRSLAAGRLRNADELALLNDPAVRRMERLAARLGDLHERSVTAVLQAAGLAVAERARAEAALGALDTLARLPVPERPDPDQAAAMVAALLDTATRAHARRANTDL